MATTMAPDIIMDPAITMAGHTIMAVDTIIRLTRPTIRAGIR